MTFFLVYAALLLGMGLLEALRESRAKSGATPFSSTAGLRAVAGGHLHHCLLRGRFRHAGYAGWPGRREHPHSGGWAAGRADCLS